jgi:stage III sporulation protein SpoIIIAA
MQNIITDDLDAMLNVFPLHIREALYRQPDISNLIEVILDLGRPPEARFPQRETIIVEQEVTTADINSIVTSISSFGEDNRAGIERTLHRISAIRNRKGLIVGLTCRVGRAVFGTIKIIDDLVQSGKSVLLLGRPGVGKTTMLREIARVLADDMKKRVIIVDTSNEIAGDGDIPHPAIGHARRMQVKTPPLQHAVMIEAVENHMPEVIVIDEIGTELEAQAARTIAERGVQLVGTAHGNTLENLMMNPTLSDLIGGIQTVTLGDEEAKRRGTQKSILERRSPPTFNIVVEIQDRDRVAVHSDVAEAVDAILRGNPADTETRWRDQNEEVHIQKSRPELEAKKTIPEKAPLSHKMPKLYLFGINRARLEQAAHDAKLNLDVVSNVADADIFVTSKNYYRSKPQRVRDAETANIPVYVLKSNTPLQMGQLLNTINPQRLAVERHHKDPMESALTEAEEAVNGIQNGQDARELSPQSAYIRRLQHLIAERNNLASSSLGKEPYRRVKIYRGG